MIIFITEQSEHQMAKLRAQKQASRPGRTPYVPTESPHLPLRNHFVGHRDDQIIGRSVDRPGRTRRRGARRPAPGGAAALPAPPTRFPPPFATPEPASPPHVNSRPGTRRVQLPSGTTGKVVMTPT